MEIRKNLLRFGIGGSAYVGLELLFRGRSHISMFGAGGLCFLLIGKLGQRTMSPVIRTLAGAGIITGVELATGLAVNRDYRVWDYRQMPGNFRGQICPAFCLIWVPVAAMADILYRSLDRKLFP